ncbi:UNVERIFIED_CONTAM: hypothetical protein NCL1_60999 [Trichonephila clavipes]
MAASVLSDTSDMPYKILMDGAQFLFTPINKRASEIKEIILGVCFPKQKNRQEIFQCEYRAPPTAEHSSI